MRHSITKSEIERSISALPDDASVQDALDRLVVLYEIDQGLTDLREGRVVSHDQVLAEMRRLRLEDPPTDP